MPVQYARSSLKTARLLLIPLGAALLAAAAFVFAFGAK